MTTARSLITTAMEDLGLLAPDLGEQPSAAEVTYALKRLNQMLDGWSTQSLTVYCKQTDTWLLTPGKNSYTLGPGGDQAITRPLYVEFAYTRDATGQDHPCRILSQDEYNLIPLKNYPASWADRVFYDPQEAALGVGTLNLIPNPQLALNFFLISMQQLAQFATANTDIVLAPGYEKAIARNLACELPGFGVDPSAKLFKDATDSRADIERLNTIIHTQPMRSDYPIRRVGVKAVSILTNGPNR